MSFFSWLASASGKRQSAIGSGLRKSKAGSRMPPRFRPQLEALENRTLPSTYYAATASDLVADINAANTVGGANTIVLTAPSSSPYVLTAGNNLTNGYNALPVISGEIISSSGKGKKEVTVTIPADNLTILTGNGSSNSGYGDVIDALGHGRLFDVAPGGSLTLKNVTLQNGLEAWAGLGVTAEGGAIFNQGTLVLNQVLVQNNTAEGENGLGQNAAGGGVWSNGSLTVENSCVFQVNTAEGSNQDYTGLLNGGSAFGGGICIAGGTASITNSFFGAYSELQGNSALGGTGGAGAPDGSGYGGAVYVGGGTVTMNADTIGNSAVNPVTGVNDGATANAAYSLGSGYGYGGGIAVAGGIVTLTNDTIIYNVAGYSSAFGGGSPGRGDAIYIAPGATVYIDSFTVTNTYGDNYGYFDGINGGIDGTYIPLV